MKKKISLLLLVVMVIAVALSGCGNKKETGDKTVKVGGTSAVTDTMDPASEWKGWYTVRYGVGETLFKLNKELTPEPWIAEKYENVDDTTWKITIKDGVTFSNGEKVTGEKVVASLKRTAEMNERAISLKNSTITADGNSVTIKTAEPYVTLVNDLCDPYAVIVDVEGTKDFTNAPICTGPFVMSKFEPEAKAEMVKNEKYWDGEVKADKVEYVKVADFNTLALSLQNGEIDVAQDLSPEAAKTVEGSDGIELSSTEQPRTYQLYFNLEKLTDKNVREAIMYGIDKETLGTKQLNGAVVPANGAFLDDTDYNGKNLKVKTNDAKQAKKLLADAGYVDTDKDGIVEKDGKPLTIQLCVYKRLAMESVATELQAQLKKIGIDLQVQVHEKSTYFSSGEFDLGIYSIVTTPVGDPYGFLRDCMENGGVANYGKYNSEKVQSLLKDLSKEFDAKKRVQIVSEIQQEAINDAAFDYIGFNSMKVGTKANISGYQTTANDYYQITKETEKK